MKQIKRRLTNKHIDFQGTPNKNFKQRHNKMMYRYIYMYDIITKIPLIMYDEHKELLYSELNGKPIKRMNNVIYGWFMSKVFKLFKNDITINI